MFINAEQQFSDRQRVEGLEYSRTLDLGHDPAGLHGAPALTTFIHVHSAEGEVHAILEESKDRAKWFILASLPNLKAGQARTPKVTPVCRHLRIKWAASAPAVVSAALVDAVPSHIQQQGKSDAA
jgi:hypothetical protein